MVYCDTSCLLKLYVEEPDSELATVLVQKYHRGSILFSKFQELELKSAIEAKCHRREITIDDATVALETVTFHKRGNYLILPVLDWNQVFDRGIQIATSLGRESGIRSLDILHVATALAIGCGTLLTFDHRQAKVSRALGLDVLPE